MPEGRSRFVLVCQQAFAVAVIGAVAASAVGVMELEIVPPDGGSSGTLVSSAPVEPTVRSVPLPNTEGDGSDLAKSRNAQPAAQEIRSVSGPEPVEGYATVGVTWDGDRVPDEDDVTVEVRTYDDGAWSSWQPMHYDAEHGPDAKSPEAHDDSARNGTEPIVVGAVEDVQVRATTTDGEPLDGLELDIIDPGTGSVKADRPSIDTGALSAAYTSQQGLELAAGGVPKPKIYSRAQWGADESMREKGALSYGKVSAGFVHHTVNANSYTEAQVPQILRGIYAYHTKSRGWSDVGYNFFVDRFGRIWEGRYGGVDKAVVGAHTYGFNGSSFAMSAIGNFEVAEPTSAMVTAYGTLMAWKLALHGVDASSDKVWVTSRYFQPINGHRDAGSTACPGRYLYAKLSAIRSRAEWLQNMYGGTDASPPATSESTPEPSPSPTPQPVVVKPAVPTTKLALNLSGARWPDLVMRDRRTKHLVVTRTSGQLSFARGVVAAKRWKNVDLVVAPGDLDGDGLADLVARSATTGNAAIYAGTAKGTAGRALSRTSRFATLDQLTGVGDFDGDGRNDLVGRTGMKRLALFPGRGDGTFGTARVLAARWNGYRATTGVDDFTGDGRPDLVARTATRVYLVPGTGTGIGRARLLNRTGSDPTWGGFDIVTGRGDVSGDGHPDLVARSRSIGMVYVYTGDGRGRVTSRLGGFKGFHKQRWLAATAQLGTDKRPDMVGLDATGNATIFPHTGRQNLSRPIDTGVVADDINLLVNAGDWNGDGLGDVMTRKASNGLLQLRAGTKSGSFAAPVTVRTSTARLTRLVAVGDMNGDGWPDLVGTDANGEDRVFPNYQGKRIGTSYVLRNHVRGSSQAGISHWDGDKIPDMVVRDGRDLEIWSSRTGKATRVGTVSADYDWLLGLGDLDADGRADLVGRSRSGYLYLLPGTSTGFGAPRLMGGGFGGYDYGS